MQLAIFLDGVQSGVIEAESEEAAREELSHEMAFGEGAASLELRPV